MKTTFNKHFLIIALFAIIAMIFTGCKKNKDNDPAPAPTPDPGPTTTTVYYHVGNTYLGDTGDPCFHFTFSYTEADGSTVTIEDATLPWYKTITVEAPFEATLEGNIYYNEDDMPDEGLICFCKTFYLSDTINPNPSWYKQTLTKEKLLQIFAAHPDRLTFSKTLTIEQ